MKALQSGAILAIFIACHLAGAARAETYTAKLLHPIGTYAGSVAKGVSAANQIGDGYLLGTTHALVWHGTADSVVDLNPNGFQATFGYAASGNSQVGYGFGTATGNNLHALLWHGAAESYVDLHPSGFLGSNAWGVFGNSQVGWGVSVSSPNNENALLWNGTAESVVQLHPNGFRTSIATAVHANSQVGYGILSSGWTHALKWAGTAASVVDLHPLNYRDSFALGAWGDTQVGYGYDSFLTTRALMWKGTAGSFVDLHPTGFIATEAHAVSEEIQVGLGRGPATSFESHALLWHGTAASYVDLHPFVANLPVPIVATEALGIDADGNIVGIGLTNPNDRFRAYAILWTPVPEPKPSAILGSAVVGYLILVRCFRQSHRQEPIRS